MKKSLTIVAVGLVLCIGVTTNAATMDFNSTLHAGTGFTSVGTSPDYTENGFKMSAFNGGLGLGNWGSGSAHFLTDPTMNSGSSNTWLEVIAESGGLINVQSIDVVDFIAAQAAGNVGVGSVTFYGIKADDSIVASTFTFGTATYDKETHALPASFTDLTKLTWNQNGNDDSENNAIIAAAHGSAGDMTLVANKAHFVDNIVLTEVAAVPEPTSIALLGLGLIGLCSVRRRFK